MGAGLAGARGSLAALSGGGAGMMVLIMSDASSVEHRRLLGRVGGLRFVMEPLLPRLIFDFSEFKFKGMIDS